MSLKVIATFLMFILMSYLNACNSSGDGVPHGREILPERVPGECPCYPEEQDLSECTTEGSEDYEEPCSKHGDCVENEYGFCLSEVDSFACHCLYHQCITDDECQAEEACLCSLINECTQSCRSSSECGENNKCIKAGIGASCGKINYDSWNIGVLGYRCTGAEDECASDYDCPADEYCVFDESKEHFACIWLVAEEETCE